MFGLFSPRWLLLLPLFCLVFFLGVAISAKRAHRSIGINLRDIMNLSVDCLRFRVAQIAANMTISLTISLLIFGVLCWSHGYYYRGDKENRVRYTYTEVMILERHSATRFSVQPARMPKWETEEMCDAEDWQPFQKLISMTFSVRKRADGTTCKDVEGGGEWYRYTKNGKPLIFPQETITDVRY